MDKFGPAVGETDLEQLAGLCQLLSDKTRLRILMLLADGERNVTSLCENLNLPQPTVSHHLGQLRIRNLISHRRLGKRVFYALNGILTPGGEGEMTLSLEKVGVKIFMKEAGQEA